MAPETATMFDPILNILRATEAELTAEPQCMRNLLPHVEALRMAVEGYDDTARCEIECHTQDVQIGRYTWYDTTASDCADDPFLQGFVTTALRYLQLRGHVVSHPVRPELVRFVHATPP